MSKKLFLGADSNIFRNALALRNNPTHAEIILWGHLKGSQLGTKFRRQHPLGIYIADFYSHQHKLIIELDGSIHNLPEVIANDIERQKSLEADGFKFLRFTNNEIYNSLESVLTTIKQATGSPFRGRGGAHEAHHSLPRCKRRPHCKRCKLRRPA